MAEDYRGHHELTEREFSGIVQFKNVTIEGSPGKASLRIEPAGSDARFPDRGKTAVNVPLKLTANASRALGKGRESNIGRCFKKQNQL